MTTGVIYSRANAGRPKKRRSSRSVARRFFTHPGGLIPGIIILVVLVATYSAPLIQMHDPAHIDYDLVNAMPSWQHILGGDAVGRDLWSRLVWGGQEAFLGALIVMVVGIGIGVPAGLLGGYFGGLPDSGLSWISDALMSVPGMIVLLIVAGGTNGNMLILMAVMGVFMAPGYYRLTRAATMAVRNEPYVDAAKVSGVSHSRIVGSHILRVIAAPIIIQTSLTAGVALGMQAGLQFIGIGDTLKPSWGGMMSDGMKSILTNPWLMVPPAIVLGLVIASFAIMGSTLGQITGTRSEKVRRLTKADRRGIRARATVSAGLPAPEQDVAVRVRGLKVSYALADRESEVLHGVDFEVRTSKVLGIVGESGSGKSQSVFALLDLLPGNAIAQAEGIWIDGANVQPLSHARRRALLGRDIAYIPQEPISNLDPMFTIGHQLIEPMRAVLKMGKRGSREYAISLLRRVGITDPERVMKLYPHEVSGGMAQRVLIAGALAGRPKLLVADEPTTALDVTVQAEVLELLRELQAEEGMALIIVTHNFGVVADICDDVTVMKDGRVIEAGPVRDIFRAPADPYTRELIAACLDDSESRRELDEHAERRTLEGAPA
ncbi:dipeptide/oligopeptide/nickel ABC transporter permease/ATP-binding protein [Microbacterium protaetiae]|uniref:Dipeptide/oligopeptide/nickel ABC transporter permease/ATP-binding protein n=1 Tax=Microbacterium protaetiae TaxID=2509458 RepID=A0A4V0YCZ0_9MICO|nr:dipeptide/oligopeptide/nickel ABC transporter permease/ATP-binding protein [Microbacterium protaetiae]QAY58881.1 dipeptide/oligopeptide/nickel ABC transporter permease/ATP-binding protein [Microbacterium protaetiae]